MKSYQPYDSLTFFPLDEGYEIGIALASKIEAQLPLGRTIITLEDAGVLAQTILWAKHADHIEIGTLFGGTAILAALVKKHFGMHGMIHCVDPLDKRPTPFFADRSSSTMATRDSLFENAAQFDVEDRIILHQSPSKPWPLDRDMRFGTGYIDGDHWNGMPAHDWKIMRDICTLAVVFDDYCIGKPEIVDVVSEAASDPRWMLVRISGMSAVMKRRM